MAKQLEKLMFVQGGRCFFCEQRIPATEASVEHLIARANGGPNSEDNCVACCKSLNALLANKPLKEKLRIVLNQRGQFKCPGHSSSKEASCSTGSNNLRFERLSRISADLKNRRPALPRTVNALRNTIDAVFQKKLTAEEIVSLLDELQSSGQITVRENKVEYQLAP
ncbi:MAG: HNH endonuclease [Nitrosospira multiformis]|nr:HNH endonuclease [Nitrosospira multiformis]